MDDGRQSRLDSTTRISSRLARRPGVEQFWAAARPARRWFVTEAGRGGFEPDCETRSTRLAWFKSFTASFVATVSSRACCRSALLAAGSPQKRAEGDLNRAETVRACGASRRSRLRLVGFKSRSAGSLTRSLRSLRSRPSRVRCTGRGGFEPRPLAPSGRSWSTSNPSPTFSSRSRSFATASRAEGDLNHAHSLPSVTRGLVQIPL